MRNLIFCTSATETPDALDIPMRTPAPLPPFPSALATGRTPTHNGQEEEREKESENERTNVIQLIFIKTEIKDCEGDVISMWPAARPGIEPFRRSLQHVVVRKFPFENCNTLLCY